MEILKNWRRFKFSPPVDATRKKIELHYTAKKKKNRKRILFTPLIGSRSYLPKLQRRKCLQQKLSLRYSFTDFQIHLQATNTSGLKYFRESVFEDVPTRTVPKIIFEMKCLKFHRLFHSIE